MSLLIVVRKASKFCPELDPLISIADELFEDMLQKFGEDVARVDKNRSVVDLLHEERKSGGPVLADFAQLFLVEQGDARNGLQEVRLVLELLSRLR